MRAWRIAAREADAFIELNAWSALALFVVGFIGGIFLDALDGAVDFRLAMIILAGSLFGIQIGAIGTRTRGTAR